jgi:ketosteroid isomerase-like protein/quercetin dioxygenase-like cupin family protein
MHRSIWILGLAAVWGVACNQAADVAKEREALLAADRAWSDTTKDVEKYMSYYASDAAVYAPGAPVASGGAAIRKMYTDMSGAPGFALRWTATKADVSKSGDLGETAGTFELTMNGATEKGKYVTVWKKQADGAWKVTDDIFNTDAAGPPPSQHVAVKSADITWGDPPPVLPKGAKLAVIAGDPGKPAPFAIRLQMPAGYRIAPHWHPTDENLTIIAGTFVLGMGEKFDEGAAKDLPTGSYAVLPATMRHFAMAKGPTTVQVTGTGPFVINYVNPADDPSKAQK